MKIEGVIFDLDGLILDTEKLYQRFWREAAAECGFSMTQETALKLRSLDKTLAKKLLRDEFGEGFDYERVKQTRIRLMSAFVDEHGVKAKPGVRELCEYLKSRGIPTAIATATNYERTNDYLTRAGVRDCFETIVCACDLEHGKPYPDVYLYACEKLGLKPENCVALEDSPNGVKSAHSAGCKVICVPDDGARAGTRKYAVAGRSGRSFSSARVSGLACRLGRCTPRALPSGASACAEVSTGDPHPSGDRAHTT